MTHGPYRWVRHPMYTVLYILWIAVFLLRENWPIGGVFLTTLTLMIGLRIRNEEATMITKFSKGFQESVQHTGWFPPRLGHAV